MTSSSNGTHPGLPGIDEVLRDIAYYRRLIRQAEQAGTRAGRAARATYRPFLSRRLQLLRALRDGRAADWRAYPGAGRAACHEPGGPRASGRRNH